MRFQRPILSTLAAVSALASPLPKDEQELPESYGRCKVNCVRQALLPFVTAAGEEGFRQALGAHNTTQLCMTTSGCRETGQISSTRSSQTSRETSWKPGKDSATMPAWPTIFASAQAKQASWPWKSDRSTSTATTTCGIAGRLFRCSSWIKRFAYS
jgi:hypothetical protein